MNNWWRNPNLMYSLFLIGERLKVWNFQMPDMLSFILVLRHRQRHQHDTMWPFNLDSSPCENPVCLCRKTELTAFVKEIQSIRMQPQGSHRNKTVKHAGLWPQTELQKDRRGWRKSHIYNANILLSKNTGFTLTVTANQWKAWWLTW